MTHADNATASGSPLSWTDIHDSIEKACVREMTLERENRLLLEAASPTPMDMEKQVRDKADELRIDLIGFSKVEKTSYDKAIRDRISRGLIKEEMVANTECFRIPEIYADPDKSLHGARTLICVGSAYLEHREKPKEMALHGTIGRHVWRDSYTDLSNKRDELIKYLKERGFNAERAKVHPREAARETGLAWIGRNAFAINPTYGSWVVYYALVTDADIAPTTRIAKTCPKNCRKCMDACPTKAIVEPYVLNVGRCLNYLMEKKGSVPNEFRVAMGNRINGCDTCQEVCPMNSRAKPCPQPRTATAPDPELVPYPKLARLFDLTQADMDKNFAHMDWHEPTIRFLRRNALVAAGNSGEKELIGSARPFVISDDEMLKELAHWALDMLSK